MLPFAVVQLNVTPEVLEEPAMVTCVTEQVICLSAPAPTFGAVVFVVTKAVSTAVHPLNEVTVNIYVPEWFTRGVAVDPPETITPPFDGAQLYVAPEVEDEPLKLIDGPVVQLITLSGPAL